MTYREAIIEAFSGGDLALAGAVTRAAIGAVTVEVLGGCRGGGEVINSLRGLSALVGAGRIGGQIYVHPVDMLNVSGCTCWTRCYNVNGSHVFE